MLKKAHESEFIEQFEAELATVQRELEALRAEREGYRKRLTEFDNDVLGALVRHERLPPDKQGARDFYLHQHSQAETSITEKQKERDSLLSNIERMRDRAEARRNQRLQLYMALGGICTALMGAAATFVDKFGFGATKEAPAARLICIPPTEVAPSAVPPSSVDAGTQADSGVDAGTSAP